MTGFETKKLPDESDVLASNGAGLRIFLNLKDGGMAHFKFRSDQTSTAVFHRTVEEIWIKGKISES